MKFHYYMALCKMYNAQSTLLFRLGRAMGNDRILLQGLKQGNKSMKMLLKAVQHI